jgi:hypothetical protein
MDQDSLIQIIRAVHAQEAHIDWDPIFWTAGIVGTVIGALISVVIYLVKRSGDIIIEVQVKHNEEIKENQLAIKEIATRQEHSIEQTDKRLQMIEKKVFKL